MVEARRMTALETREMDALRKIAGLSCRKISELNQLKEKDGQGDLDLVSWVKGLMEARDSLAFAYMQAELDKMHLTGEDCDI